MALKDFFDSYTLKARVAPTVTLITFLIFLYINYLRPGIHLELNFVNIFFESLIGLSLLFISSGFIRSFGKFIIEKIMFNGKLNMPTTQLLLNEKQKTISKKKKDQIIKYFIDDLHIDIEERKRLLEGETSELKKEISEAISILRNRTRDDQILFEANISYGLWRNFAGALGIALIILLLLIGLNIFVSLLPFEHLIAYLICCLILLLIALILTRISAFEYADLLFTNLLSIKHQK